MNYDYKLRQKIEEFNFNGGFFPFTGAMSLTM